MKKYYRILMDSYSVDDIGMLYPPKDTSYFSVLDREIFENMTEMEFELRDGCYAPWLPAIGLSKCLNEELKELFSSYISSDYPLKFLPVRVKSKKYGDEKYYTPYFTKIFDVLDEEHTKRFPPAVTIFHPALVYDKVKDYDIFVYDDLQRIIISNDVLKKMKKLKLNEGLAFLPVKCY